MPMQHMKAPESAQCYASTLYENPQSVPCQCNTWRFPNELGAQRNTWRFPNELSAMPAQYMKAPEQARCHVSAIHEGSRTSSETQKLLVQAIEETVRNVKFFLKANSVIEEQKSTVRFAGTCNWSDCISSPNISSFVGHGLMNGAVAPCSAFTSRVKVRMYMSLCLHVIAGFTHTHATFHTQLCHPPSLTPHLSHHFVTHTPPFTHNFVTHHLSPHHLSHHFVTHHLSPHHLSHTTLSHTIFPTQLCHTHTTLFYFSNPPPPPLSFLSSPSPLQHLVLIIGRSCHVGLSGPLIFLFFPFLSTAFFISYFLLDIDVSANVILWLLRRTWMQIGATLPVPPK